MSEFQYHEWQTIDRVLTPDEQTTVNKLSSHITVSSSKAVVTYHWSDLRHDPKQVLLKYFDAYFFRANWGSLRLMFRFPKELLDQTESEPYLDGENVSLETIGEYQVLDIKFNPVDGGWMQETNADLSDFISLRADLLQGDYRLLYLTWLKEMLSYGEPDEGQDEDEDSRSHDFEPPVPPDLKQLSPALQNIVRVFDIDPFLVQAAAEASPQKNNPLAVDYYELIGRLPRAECDDFLTRLVEGNASIGLALRKRLSDFLPQDKTPQLTGKRTLRDLLQLSRQLKEVEEKRQTEEARKKFIVEMKSLAGREAQVWQAVDQLLGNGRKIASVYDEATTLLEKLQQLSEFQDTCDIFHTRVLRLAKKYASRPSLMERWRHHGWLVF